MILTAAQLLQKIKTDLRIDFDDLDEDISDNIHAAMIDLQTGGAAAGYTDTDGTLTAEMDELTLRGIKLYCRWQYNFDGNADRYERAYGALKIVLAVDDEHRADV